MRGHTISNGESESLGLGEGWGATLQDLWRHRKVVCFPQTLMRWYSVKKYQRVWNVFLKKHKRFGFMTLLQSEENRFFFKHLTLFDISLPNITSSAIQLQVSRIPNGFSGRHSLATIALFFLFLYSSPPHRESSRFSGNKNDCFLF